ncbi:MAG: ankyrin repeat domain-containing protein [Polyangia bacterium]
MSRTKQSLFTTQWNERAVAAALASPDALNRQDDVGATALWSAVYFGHADWVRRLLEAGARMDAHDAARIDRSDGANVVVALWRGVPDHADRAPTGRGTLLHVAAAHAGSVEVASILLERGVPVDERDRFGCTALHIASFHGRVPLAALLLDHGAAIDVLDVTGHTPLDHCNLNIEVVDSLLKRGAAPDGGNKIAWEGSGYEWSLLTSAAAMGRADVVEALLAAGAHVERHREALPLAAKHGHTAVVRRLLAAGAALDATTSWRGEDRLPLEAAAMYASLGCAKLLLERMRAEPGAQNQQDQQSQSAGTQSQIDRALLTALAFSSEDRPTPPNDRGPARKDLVTFLLQAGADAKPALLAAARLADAGYVERIVRHGVDVNLRDAQGRTALHHAASLGNLGVVQKLLQVGADPRAADQSGTLPYQLAEKEYRRAGGADDARLVMRALNEAGTAPPAPAQAAAPAPPATGGELVVGGAVSHPKFGRGRILRLAGSGDDTKLTIDFGAAGSKVLLARFVKPLGR